MSLVMVFICFFIFDLDKYATIDFFKSRQALLTGYQGKNPLFAAIIFFSAYVLVTCLSLPAATLMTIIGGAVFGLFQGVLLVSFASSIGATLAFLLSRYLFRDVVQNRYSRKLKILNDGVEKEGAFYLFTLRMIPVFPFFIINAVMGLTPIKTRIFYLASQAGMLPATIIYVNAGSQISQITSPGDILSPKIFLSFALLGVFPLITKKIIDYLRARRSGDANGARKP